MAVVDNGLINIKNRSNSEGYQVPNAFDLIGIKDAYDEDREE